MKRIVTFDAAYSLKFANQYSIAKYIYYFGKIKSVSMCNTHMYSVFYQAKTSLSEGVINQDPR